MRTNYRSRRSGLAAKRPQTVIERLRRGMEEATLDCGCRQIAYDVLDRVGAEESRIHRAGGLADARKMRDAIVLVLGFLSELDELTPDESDRTAFIEIAGLFEDVVQFADFGAAAARRAAGERTI